MKNPPLTALLLLLPAMPFWAGAAESSLNGHLFTLPDGFVIELAAGPNLAPRPIAGSFDPQGRLYVTDSSGSNLPPSEQLKDPKSRILRLDDTDGDGVFDRSVVFADRVMFPQGCLWHDGSVYVAGPPSIWKFTDTDGDGAADRREEWYQGNVLTGCANDVHGPYLGPEGKFYWTKGAFARLDLKDHRGRPIDDRCAHIFRSWPDGSEFESVISGGMDNPVEIAFTAEGEPIVISTFIDLSQPGRRDGLAHAVYGGVFGKVNDVVDEPMVRRTGDLMPILTQFGPAAACALMRYSGDGFGTEFRDNLFGTLFNLRKVTRHVLHPSGASYRAEDSDFLVSDQFDFRPTDVLQDADGSLLVVDTGGWYKLCCPSSQLAKADVLGGIYRVRRQGHPSGRPPTLNQELRATAYARLAEPQPLVTNSPLVDLKLAAHKADPASASTFRAALTSNLHQAATSPTAAHLARVAAEGLGRIRDRDAVPILFAALREVGDADRFLQHSLLYALIETGDAASVRPFLAHNADALRRAALLVLEQIGDRGSLTANDVLPALASDSESLRATARWITRRHPEWSESLVLHLRRRLTAPGVPDSEKETWESLFGLLVQHPEGQAFLADAATDAAFRPASRIAALQAIAGSSSKQTHPSWRTAVLSCLQRAAQATPTPSDTPGNSTLLAALQSVRGLALPKEGDPEITAVLHAIAAKPSLASRPQLEALAALPPGASISPSEFERLIQSLAPERPATDRLAAANAAARLRLSPGQLHSLTDAVRTAGPVELQRLLGAFAPGGDINLGKRLIDSLAASKSLRSLRPEDFKTSLAKFPPSIGSAAEELLATHQSDASQDRARLDALLSELQSLPGSVRDGQTLFNSAKAACSTCHRMGYLGGDVGPDLTSIGTVRSERDLLEAVVFPSVSFVRSYEPWVIEATDNEEYSGILRRETESEVVLATGPGTEIRLPRSEIVTLRSGTLSTMPAGLDEQLSRQELADLLAFLKNTKWGAN